MEIDIQYFENTMTATECSLQTNINPKNFISTNFCHHLISPGCISILFLKKDNMLQLGFVSAILADKCFEEVIDFAADHMFSCVEMMCWPPGKAERRYAGVTHINVDDLGEENINHIKGLFV